MTRTSLKQLMAVALAVGGVTVGCGDDNGSSDPGDDDGGGMTMEDSGTNGGTDAGGNGGDEDAGGNGGDEDAGGGTVATCADEPDDSFFEDVSYVGAVKPGGPNWADAAWTSLATDGSGPGGATPSNPTQVGDGTGDAHEITSDTTWTSDQTWLLTEKVFVMNDATLTIEAGTVVMADSGAALVVTRGSTLDAVGEEDNPIVFTSSKPDGNRQAGDWPGVILLGNAPINVGDENSIEGLPTTDPRGKYGGDDPDNNCGTLEHVRIEYTGDTFSPDNEIQGLTVGACGSNTTIENFQSHHSTDDGLEFFGGTANLKRVILSYAQDDSLDWDQGYSGKIQFLVIRQPPGSGDNGMETDNNGDDLDAMPRSNPTIFNMTNIGAPGSAARAWKAREGTWATIRNSIFQNHAEAFDIIDAETVAGTETDPPELVVTNSMFFDIDAYFPEEAGDADNDGGFLEADYFMMDQWMNLFGVDPMLDGPAAEPPNFQPASGSPAMCN